MPRKADLRAFDLALSRLPKRLAATAGVAAVRAAAGVLAAEAKRQAPVESGRLAADVAVLPVRVKGDRVSGGVVVDGRKLPSPGEPAAVEFGTHDRAADPFLERAVDVAGARAGAEAARAFAREANRELWPWR